MRTAPIGLYKFLFYLQILKDRARHAIKPTLISFVMTNYIFYESSTYIVRRKTRLYLDVPMKTRPRPSSIYERMEDSIVPHMRNKTISEKIDVKLKQRNAKLF